MIDTEKGSLMQRMVGFATGKGFATKGERASTGTASNSAVLLWLAGGTYRPKKRPSTPRPTSRRSDEIVHRILETDKPETALDAAAMRADLLMELRRKAREHPVTEDIFAADPIIAEDPRTGHFVCNSMCEARLSLFDVLLTLFGRPVLDGQTRDRMRRSLGPAFSALSPSAQREWTLSEVRLEEGLSFVEGRSGQELRALTAELSPVMERRGLWDTTRLFSHAAQMAHAPARKRDPVGDLLEITPELRAA